MFSNYSKLLLLLGVIFWGNSAEVTAEEQAAPSRTKFNRDIRPIFVAHCLACHGGVKQAGDVSFSYAEKVLPPDGWIVEPGAPDDSELIARVTSDDPELRMPPPEHGPALTEQEVTLLRQWIAEGAEWQSHWAFEKPIAADTPAVSDESWPSSDLDRFVLAKLDEAGLRPSAESKPYRWLRRVSLDLVGLPPTPEELARFLDKLDVHGELAYKQEVDRLLNSEQFGERWASVWLDQVRYADSMGLGVDARRTIWLYRNWVIRALNEDLPYDQFTIMQIAGDLLPDAGPDDLIATACHRLTQSNSEGGTDDEEFRIAAVLDRVNTTWQTWQGITFGCVQCHSHPYEPIEQPEYYKFAAFFNNTADCDLDDDAPHYHAPTNPKDYSRAKMLDKQIDALRDSIWQTEFESVSQDNQWNALTSLEASSNKATQLEVQQLDNHAEFRTKGTVEQNTDITLVSDLPTQMKQLAAFRVTAAPLNREQAIADSEWGFVWSHVEASLLLPESGKSQPIKIARVIGDESQPFHDPQESLNPKSKYGFSAYSRIHYPRTAVFVLDEAMDIPPNARIQIKLRHRIHLLAAFSLITRRGHVAVSDDAEIIAATFSPNLKARRQRLAELRKQRNQIESVKIPILRERPDRFARPTHVFVRGLFLDKGELVTPATPASMPQLSDNKTPDRLALAEWLVSPENPLTSRVAVNRLWARLFGVGLVETEEDFGSSGQPPSHPALLDYLAIKFQHDFNWSVKELLREIVLSSTYRQSSVFDKQTLEQDPTNRLLSRGPRHRLPAEVIRDQALAISGLLNMEMYGPPVHPPLPAGVWSPFSGGDKWPQPKPGDPARYRRSVYTYIKRSIPYPMHTTFDQPSREFCAPRRLRSNTPLQALELLNGESFAECAVALADRMRERSDTLDQQISHGFLLAVCRPPSPSELANLKALHDQYDGERGLVVVATALLNLDELVMK